MAAGVNSRLHKHVWIGVTSRPQQPPAPTTIITLPRLLAISHFYISWTIQDPHLHLDIFLRLFSPLISPGSTAKMEATMVMFVTGIPPFQAPGSSTDGNLQCGQQRKQQKRGLHVRGYLFSTPTGFPRLT